ncbi:MAG: helix-turn-helix domain-containing protein [Ktedonobacterales bacterium]
MEKDRLTFVYRHLASGLPMLARHIHLQPHFSVRELENQYRTARDPIERSRWDFLWLLSRGFTATTIATITGCSAYWIGQMARRYNREGPDGVRDRRHRPKAGTPLLSQVRQHELRDVLRDRLETEERRETAG